MKLAERIRHHADQIEDPTAGAIAVEVARDIVAEADGDAEQLVELIATVAAAAVRAELGNGRANATTGYKRAVTNPDPKASPSARFERRRSAWARMLDERVMVGGVYKRQGDCTVEDLQAAVVERETHIEKVRWHVSRLNACIAAMERLGVATLGEVPEGAIDEMVLAVAA